MPCRCLRHPTKPRAEVDQLSWPRCGTLQKVSRSLKKTDRRFLKRDPMFGERSGAHSALIRARSAARTSSAFQKFSVTFE